MPADELVDHAARNTGLEILDRDADRASAAGDVAAGEIEGIEEDAGERDRLVGVDQVVVLALPAALRRPSSTSRPAGRFGRSRKHARPNTTSLPAAVFNPGEYLAVVHAIPGSPQEPPVCCPNSHKRDATQVSINGRHILRRYNLSALRPNGAWLATRRLQRRTTHKLQDKCKHN